MQFIVIERCSIHKIVHHSLASPSSPLSLRAKAEEGEKGRDKPLKACRSAKIAYILTSVVGCFPRRCRRAPITLEECHGAKWWRLVAQPHRQSLPPSGGESSQAIRTPYNTLVKGETHGLVSPYPSFTLHLGYYFFSYLFFFSSSRVSSISGCKLPPQKMHCVCKGIRHA